jgi:hypothetical protein
MTGEPRWVVSPRWFEPFDDAGQDESGSWVVASSWCRRRRGRAGSVGHHLRSVAGNDLTNVMTEIRWHRLAPRTPE